MIQKNLHQEHHFEAAICQHRAANGWLSARGEGLPRYGV